MKLPDIYGYGSLFGFSGLNGENNKENDFIGVTVSEKLTVRFDSIHPLFLHIDTSGDVEYILSDIIKLSDAVLIFSSCDTVIGKAEKCVSIFTDEARLDNSKDGVSVLENDGFFFALATKFGSFALCRGEERDISVSKAKSALSLSIRDAEKAKLEYYLKLPRCPSPNFEKLYYKCLSVNKVNVYSPQSGISCRFTTPDRLPHRHMWLWDSMFHALAMVNYNYELAKDCVRSVLECQSDDGFIPHMMKSREDVSSITQPQVIAWATLEVYKKTGDIGFLRECAGKIDKFLSWFTANRDLNENDLFEWKTDFSNVRCRCDESGMDNSPRFDTTERLDAIDASCFMAHDCRCMAEIYSILGDADKAEEFKALGKKTQDAVNALLWDESTGAYCDRTFSGDLTGSLSVCSFLPLFAEIATPERAERLVHLLKDKNEFATAFPIPSISKSHPDYGTDMWRGGVWLNFNYFIIQGLKKYGYVELADEIKRKTLDTVNRIFEETGNIHEFYDPEDRVMPLRLNRKGVQPPIPDYRTKYHSITDFNWSACFTYLLIIE